MMKTFLQILLFTVIAFSVEAQVVTTEPAFVTLNQPVTITFDASKGNGGLKDNNEDWYAHTGVITDKSAGGSDWKYVKTKWPGEGGATPEQVNLPANKLTKTGNNKATLRIEDIRAYYGVPADEKILRICLVFRNPTGSKEGKDDGGKDIFVDVYETGLSVKFTAPASSVQLINKGTTVTFSALASQSAPLRLYVDNTQFASTTGISITQTYTFNNAGAFWAIVEAGTAPNTTRDSIYVNVKKDVETAARPISQEGITILSENIVYFSLYAPGKNDIFLVGDFNNGLPDNDYMMKKDGDYWWLTLNNLQPNIEYAFQYLVDGNLYVGDAYTQKVLDPWNDRFIPTSTYPNLRPYPQGKDINDGLVSVFQTNETPYKWEVANFKPPREDKLVIYELLIRDFTETGDLNGVMSKLDYLKNLGINAIELMPTQEFDGNDSWGYNPCYYFAMDKAYGTKEMYKQFIDECHKRGIAVILDVVYNHATGTHPFAKLYWDAANNRTAANNPWFNVVAPHELGLYHDFNHESPLVRAYIKRNLKFMLEEYKLDGFRFDLTKGFTNKSTGSAYDASRINILKDYYGQIKETKSDALMIIEHFCDDAEERELANVGIIPWGNKNNAYCQTAMGYRDNSDFYGVNGWTKGWTFNNLVGFMESHDEERTMYKAKAWGAGNISTNLAVRMDRAALNAAFYLPLPGAKMIWQFGELGYDYSIHSMAGTDEIKEPDYRTARKEIRWDYFNMPERKAVYNTYYKLNKLREFYGEAFNNPSWWDMQAGYNDWDAGRRICLKDGDLKMVILGNFNPSGSTATYPNFPAAGTWYDLMTDETINVVNTNMSITLAAGKFKVLTNKKLNIPSGINDVKKIDFDLYQTSDHLTILSEEPVFAAKIYTVNGLLIKQIQNENTVSIAGLPKGCYIINIELSGRNVACKFVK